MAWIDGKYCVVDEARGVYCEVAPLVRNAKDGSVLALVPGGEFEMGDGSAKRRVGRGSTRCWRARTRSWFS